MNGWVLFVGGITILSLGVLSVEDIYVAAGMILLLMAVATFIGG